MAMARSYLGRRPRPASSSSVPGEASSTSRRRTRTHFFPASPPLTSVQGSPTYSPTSPSYSNSRTSPPYAPAYRSPLAEAYYPGLPELDDDAIGDEVPAGSPEDEDYENYSLEEEEEEEEEERSESDDDDDGMEQEDDSYGSGGDNGEEGDEELDGGDDESEGDREQEVSDGSDDGEHGEEGEEEHYSDDDEIGDEQSEGDREQEVSDGSDDGENGVEEEREEEEEEEEEEGEEEAAAAAAAPPRQPHDVQGNVAAVDREHAPLPRPASCSQSSGVGEMTVTVERTELDCGICALPLKPPIFQCDVGHVACSPCRDKLPAAGRCHVCRSTTGFRRCHAMEHLVESIRVPCPHAAHGCAVRPAYHGRDRHARECRHAPCRCPGHGRHGCMFRGSVTALVDHIVAEHGWPCTAETTAGRSFGVDLRDGFNFLTAVRGDDDRYLLLLDVASTAFGRAISAVWIGSHAAAAAAATAAGAGSSNTTTCRLELICSRYEHFQSGHFHSSKFQVACTDPSNGLPDPNESFQFFVPKYVGGGGSAAGEAAVRVTAVISIRSS